MRALTPHERLCMLAASIAPSPAAVEALARDPAMDWPAAVRCATRHGVAHTLAELLKAGGAPVPAEITNCLLGMLAANRRRNELLLGDASRLLHRLDAGGIDAWLLKGAALACQVYAEPGLRGFADIDVLVEPGRIEHAVEAAVSLGFTPSDRPGDGLHVECSRDCGEDILTGTLPMDLDPSIPREVVARVCRHVKLEMHTGLFRDASSRARSVDLLPFVATPTAGQFPDGTEFRTLGAEATLVHLCAHAASHGFSRLLFPMDIALLIGKRGDRVDWSKIWSLAKAAGVAKNVASGLALAAELGAPVPESFRLDTGFALADVVRSGREGDTGVLRGRLRNARGFGERAQAVGRLLVPEPAAMRRIHGDCSALGLAGHYAARPLRLLHKAARDLFIASR